MLEVADFEHSMRRPVELLRHIRTLLLRPTSWAPTYSYRARYDLNGEAVVGYLMKRRNPEGATEYRAMTGYEARKHVFEHSKRRLRFPR